MINQVKANDLPSKLNSKDKQKFAELVQTNDVCKAQLSTCESDLQKAINKEADISFFQDPVVIIGSVATAFVAGFVIASVSRGN